MKDSKEILARTCEEIIDDYRNKVAWCVLDALRSDFPDVFIRNEGIENFVNGLRDKIKKELEDGVDPNVIYGIYAERFNMILTKEE